MIRSMRCIKKPRLAQTEEIGERANNLALVDILNCQYLLGQAIHHNLNKAVRSRRFQPFKMLISCYIHILSKISDIYD